MSGGVPERRSIRGPGVVSCLWKKLQRVRRVAAGYSGDAFIKLFSHNCCVD